MSFLLFSCFTRKIATKPNFERFFMLRAVDFPSFYIEEQEDLHSPHMVQGLGIFICKCDLLPSLVQYLRDSCSDVSEAALAKFRMYC